MAATPDPSLTRDDLVDIFLNGRCGSFAIAAAQALQARGDAGVGVSLLFDDEQEPNTLDGRGAIHAYASSDLRDVDARGVREPADMAKEYGLNSWQVDGPYAIDELLAAFDDPIDIGVDPPWIVVAAQMIADDLPMLDRRAIPPDEE